MSKKGNKKASTTNIERIVLATSIINLLIAIINLVSLLIGARIKGWGERIPPLSLIEKNTFKIACCQDIKI